MFEGQPKGLYALALANTGERFGYYTMLAIFTLFLQAKFGYTEGAATLIYSSFLAAVYFLPLLGGLLADKLGYGKLVNLGFLVMFVGYLLIAIPAGTENAKWMMFSALALIAIGTGCFKGNLQVMVGKLYDNPQYNNKRDTAFSLFYMAINIGAMFAPYAATKVTNWMLAKSHFTYNSQIPSLAHQFLDGKITAGTDNALVLEKLKALQGFAGSTKDFCITYIDKLSEAYNYGFAVACASLVISLLIYLVFRNTYKSVTGANTVQNTTKSTENQTQTIEEQITPQESKQRVVALLLVFCVVIFFWMSFHQNGATLTYFARDYTNLKIEGLTRVGFDIWNLALLVVAVYGLFAIFQSKRSNSKIVAGVVAIAAIIGVVLNYSQAPTQIDALPQMFQQFNPFFVVVLTPVSLAFFKFLSNSGKEPSAPRKIALGMLVAALGFGVLTLGSVGLPTPNTLKADASLSVLTSPNLLISTYLVLTFAELLLSPMGISFVSKVAPPKLKGAMMGGWFAATAIGNYAVSIIGFLWGPLPLWQVWSILVTLCLLSALFMFVMMKRLEKVS